MDRTCTPPASPASGPPSAASWIPTPSWRPARSCRRETAPHDPRPPHQQSSQTEECPAMTGPMLPRERCDYSAIVDRPPLKLPGGARIIVWTIVNLEVWDISKPMARQVLPAPTGVPLLPDVPNWGWHEYGMRVGVWRFFELYKKLGVAPT